MANSVDEALLDAAAAARDEAKRAKRERARMADALIDLMIERQELRKVLLALLTTPSPEVEAQARAILVTGEGYDQKERQPPTEGGDGGGARAGTAHAADGA